VVGARTMTRVPRDTKQRWEAFAQAEGLKSTRQRDLIVDEFLRCRGHVSIEELLRRVRRRHPRVGYVTVYRTLKLLAAADLAVPRQFGDGQTRFEVADQVTRRHHDHLICTDCGLIIEFNQAEIERLQDEVARRLGFDVESHKLELYARCPRAAKRCDQTCPHLGARREGHIVPGVRTPAPARLATRRPGRPPSRGRGVAGR
jgi:Fur family transcriptional regulator, ferric uptake regulator